MRHRGTHPARGRLRRALGPAAGLLLSLALLAGCAGGGADPGPGRPSAGTERRVAPKPVRPWNTHPASVAALGDSITRGFDACHPFSDCPDASWATGSRTKVDSLARRIAPATRSWNLARSGARVADLPGQARAAAVYRPAMLTVLIGANDACRSSTDAMTPVNTFRADFGRAMAYLHRVLPGSQILVASIPDLRRLWSVGVRNPLGRQIWRLGLCPTMLRDAEAHTAAAQARRAEVRERVVAYNAVLGQVCQRYARCRYDGGAVFGYRFTTRDLSTWDWFHPNERGQAQLARILADVAFGPRRA